MLGDRLHRMRRLVLQHLDRTTRQCTSWKNVLRDCLAVMEHRVQLPYFLYRRFK